MKAWCQSWQGQLYTVVEIVCKRQIKSNLQKPVWVFCVWVNPLLWGAPSTSQTSSITNPVWNQSVKKPVSPGGQLIGDLKDLKQFFLFQLSRVNLYDKGSRIKEKQKMGADVKRRGNSVWLTFSSCHSFFRTLCRIQFSGDMFGILVGLFWGLTGYFFLKVVKTHRFQLVLIKLVQSVILKVPNAYYLSSGPDWFGGRQGIKMIDMNSWFTMWTGGDNCVNVAGPIDNLSSLFIAMVTKMPLVISVPCPLLP